MSTSVIKYGTYSNFPGDVQVNTRNLDQTIRATVVTSSPLIRFLYGTALAFDNFEEFLKEDPLGYVANASEDLDRSMEKKYIAKNKAPIGDFVTVMEDVVPPPILTVRGNFLATNNLLNFVDHAEYHALAGTKLLCIRTGEYFLVNINATSNDGISVARGLDTTTPQSLNDGDTLLVCGQHLDLLGPQIVAPSTAPRGRKKRKNGWARIMTLAMPIGPAFREEGVLYNGQFMEFVDDLALAKHKQMILNEVLYADRNGVDEGRSPIGQFNGWAYWAKQNPAIYYPFQDIGILTPSNFEALMTWFEPYEGIGSTRDNPMVYFCGTSAYKAFQKYLKHNILIQSKDHVSTTVGGVVEKYITDTGKVIFFCLDRYLDHIGRSGDCFMTAEDNLNLIIGEDEYFAPESERLQIMDAGARFCQYIPDYISRNGSRADGLISQFSLQCAYPQLLAVATGIKAPSA